MFVSHPGRRTIQRLNSNVVESRTGDKQVVVRFSKNDYSPPERIPGPAYGSGRLLLDPRVLGMSEEDASTSEERMVYKDKQNRRVSLAALAKVGGLA